MNANTYMPTIAPRLAVEALEKQQEAIGWLLNSINKVEVLVLKKKTAAEIWEYLHDAVDAYQTAVMPKE